MPRPKSYDKDSLDSGSRHSSSGHPRRRSMTGAGTSLDFNTPYANEYDVIHKTGKHYSYLTKSISDVETKSLSSKYFTATKIYKVVTNANIK